MGRNTKTAVSEKKCPYCAGSIELNAFRCPKCASWLDLEMYATLEDQKARRLNDGGGHGLGQDFYTAETFWKEKKSLEEDKDIVVTSFDREKRSHRHYEQ